MYKILLLAALLSTGGVVMAQITQHDPKYWELEACVLEKYPDETNPRKLSIECWGGPEASMTVRKILIKNGFGKKG